MCTEVMLTAWMLVKLITVDTLSCGSKEYNYLFENSYKTYEISYTSDRNLELKKGGWYKMKIKADCEAVNTSYYFNTGNKYIPLTRLVNFCNAKEVYHEEPSLNRCFFVGGLCYY